MKQHTLLSSCSFSGIGLHSGKTVSMQLLPAPDDHGIVFRRSDIDALIHARVENVCGVRRSTELAGSGARVRTVEHLLAALHGLGVDNAVVQVDGPELPILDGSALPYVNAIRRCGLREQAAARRFRTVTRHAEYRDARSGSVIVVDPCDELIVDITVDYKSPMVGVQKAWLDATVDFAAEVAPCRTFCFSREVALLRLLGLIKGGSLDNALVIDDRKMCYAGGKPPLFDNEPARHKLLDLLGDFALAGAAIRGRITAYRPGHRANTRALRQFIADAVL